MFAEGECVFHACMCYSGFSAVQVSVGLLLRRCVFAVKVSGFFAVQVMCGFCLI